MASKSNKRVIIIGAGPGGLTAGMLLAHRGFDVDIFEKEGDVGGRNGSINAKGFKFDIGPTFLMMKFILDDVFEEAGRDIKDYLNIIDLEPMYKLQFKDFEFNATTDKAKMRTQIKKLFPDETGGYDKFMKKEEIRFKRFFPCLQKDYSSIKGYFVPTFIKAIPHIMTFKSMIGILGNYFKDERLRICFTFQAKYLGMSPWKCPGQFIIIPYIEHKYGIQHVEGGLSEISQAMAKVFQEDKGRIHLDSAVKRVIIDERKAIGIELENGKKHYADKIILNADFAYSMTHLINPKHLKRWNKKRLDNTDYSCSTFMLYLGLDKIYDMDHHTIIFADDYKKNVDDIFEGRLPEDLSIYVRNASINDKTLAPKGKSSIYILVPVPNKKFNTNWKKDKIRFRKVVLDTLKKKTVMKDIEKHIEFEKIITPNDWQANNIYFGATFNLAHSLGQMLYLRPHNRFEEIDDLFIVGGGTHPGSGLPTIYESGRIAANMISKEYKIRFFTKNLEV